MRKLCADIVDNHNIKYGEPDCACTVWRIHSAFPGAHLIVRFKQINQVTGMNHHRSKHLAEVDDTLTFVFPLHVDVIHHHGWYVVSGV
jgi:hypothetical protein